MPNETIDYGNNGTIHRTEELDVEVDKDGHVVSVWFRCMALPFRAHKVDAARAKSMKAMYAKGLRGGLVAVRLKLGNKEPAWTEGTKPLEAVNEASYIEL